MFGRRLAESWIFFYVLLASSYQKRDLRLIICLPVYKGSTSRVLQFMACVHTHASYAGVVCSMEGTPWGLVL